MKGISDAQAAKEQMLGSPTDQEAGKVEPTNPIANYMGPSEGPFLCKMCEYFQEPNACEKVSGVIEEAACCNLFEKAGDNAVQEPEEAT